MKGGENGMLYVLPAIGNYGTVSFNTTPIPSQYQSFVSDIKTNGWLYSKGAYSISSDTTGESYRATTVDDAVARAYYIDGDSVMCITGYKKPCLLYLYLDRYYYEKEGDTRNIVPSDIPDVSTYRGDSATGFTNAGNIPFNSYDEAYAAIENWLGIKYPITYRPTNCTFPNAPTEAAVGDTVVVPVEFPDGYGLANTGDIYVQCNGVVIPSTYENGQLTFTMPDPS